MDHRSVYFAHVGRRHRPRFHFRSLFIARPFLPNDLSRRSISLGAFVLYGLPAPGFPPRALSTWAGKAISRKWRARYTGVRRNFEFLTGIRAAKSPVLWSDESAVCRCERVAYVSRVLVITKAAQ